MPEGKSLRVRLAELWRAWHSLPIQHPEDVDHPHIPPRVGPNLLSERGVPDAVQAHTPVVITVHGFSATPFEIHFLLEYLLARHPNWQASEILLGAHGSAIQEFRQARWQDWQQPLAQELSALQRLGYTHQMVIATSTGCTLLLELLTQRCFPHLKKLVLIAPLVKPREKVLHLAPWAARLGIQALENEINPEWIGAWYRELPLSALHQLHLLTKRLRQLLVRGIRLPRDLEILLIHSRSDQVVDPRSSFLIAQGLPYNHLELLLLDSHWHLPILPRSTESRENMIKDRVFARIDQFLQDNLPPWPVK